MSTKNLTKEGLPNVFAQVKKFTDGMYQKKTDMSFPMVNLNEGFPDIDSIRKVCEHTGFIFNPGTVVTFKNSMNIFELWQLQDTPYSEIGNWVQIDCFTALQDIQNSLANKLDKSSIEALTEEEIASAANSVFGTK